MYADPLFRAAGLNPNSIKLFIVQDDALNAYVAGGQNMFIHTGLILATDTPDMLIGVMAHESGHIAGGHLAQGAEKLKNAQLGTIFTFVLGAAAAVVKPDAGAAIISGGQNSVARNFLAYTRSNEEAADQAALTTLDKLNISASGLIKVLELLRRHERQTPNTPDPYMLTHPLSNARIEHIRDHLAKTKIPDGQYPQIYNIWHQRMVAKLYGFMRSPERTLQQYPMNDKTVAARMARAIAHYRMPDMEMAIREMDELLTELPDDPFLYELKGQMLFENGRAREALTAYNKAVSLLPNSALMLADLAKVELEQELPSMTVSAITHLEKSTTLDNTNANAWRLLATAYGKTNNIAMSYLALAEEAALQGDAPATLKQANQAIATLKQNTPAYQRAQDIKTLAIQMKKEKEDADSPF